MQQRLADQRPELSPEERQELEDSGRTICLTTCSIHPTEVGGTMMTPELVYRLATDDSPDMEKLVEDVVLLLVPSLNPFGWDMVCDWYAETLDGPFEGSAPPRLYHPVAGHDNNRDWFMQVLPETRALVSRVHNEWRPHIVHDLHQMQPTGPRYFVPPFLDPYDPNVDPLIQTQANALGSEMAADLATAGKTGVATSTIFDAYSPSRAYQHYHGGVRILSEAANARLASPVTLWRDQLVDSRGFDPRRERSSHPLPWEGGVWSLADIVEYNRIAVQSVLNHASRYRRRWVQNFTTIQRRALDSGTPFAFVLPPIASQADPVTATELVHVLQAGDVEVQLAMGPFSTATLDFPPGALVVRADQPFGRYAKTLLENQRYPEVPALPGGSPPAPYDITAHSLPLQMGVACHAVAEGFDYQAEPLPPVEPPTGVFTDHERGAGPYAFAATTNASALLANLLLREAGSLRREGHPTSSPNGVLGAGLYVVDDIRPATLRTLAARTGVDVTAISEENSQADYVLTAPRVGLYHSWRPNAIDTGWTAYVLHAYGFEPTILRNQDLRRGNLGACLDAIVLAHESPDQIVNGNSSGEYPPRYAGGIGDVGAVNLRLFVEQGGTVIALGGATALVIEALYLPVVNALDGLSSDEFSSPGSLVRVLIDPSHPLGWGFEREAVGMFVESPAFEVTPPGDAAATVVAHYPLTEPLVAGWLRGSHHLSGHAALVEVEVGQGRAILVGIRPQFRAQSRGTYRLLFNAVFRATLR